MVGISGSRHDRHFHWRMAQPAHRGNRYLVLGKLCRHHDLRDHQNMVGLQENAKTTVLSLRSLAFPRLSVHFEKFKVQQTIPLFLPVQYY